MRAVPEDHAAGVDDIVDRADDPMVRVELGVCDVGGEEPLIREREPRVARKQHQRKATGTVLMHFTALLLRDFYWLVV